MFKAKPKLHHHFSQTAINVLKAAKRTFVQHTKKPDRAIENNAVNIEQTVLNVNGHLKYTNT